MGKLDWDKASRRNLDPALAIKDCRDISLSNTPTARKEAKKKAKVRSKAAVQAAKTRKLNRRKQQESDLAALVQKEVSSSAAVEFWTQLRAQTALANEKRRAQTAQSAGILGNLGALLEKTLLSRKP